MDVARGDDHARKKVGKSKEGRKKGGGKRDALRSREIYLQNGRNEAGALGDFDAKEEREVELSCT